MRPRNRRQSGWRRSSSGTPRACSPDEVENGCTHLPRRRTSPQAVGNAGSRFQSGRRARRGSPVKSRGGSVTRGDSIARRPAVKVFDGHLGDHARLARETRTCPGRRSYNDRRADTGLCPRWIARTSYPRGAVGPSRHALPISSPGMERRMRAGPPLQHRRTADAMEFPAVRE